MTKFQCRHYLSGPLIFQSYAFNEISKFNTTKRFRHLKNYASIFNFRAISRNFTKFHENYLLSLITHQVKCMFKQLVCFWFRAFQLSFIYWGRGEHWYVSSKNWSYISIYLIKCANSKRKIRQNLKMADFQLS